jgi:hypothetical protein
MSFIIHITKPGTTVFRQVVISGIQAVTPPAATRKNTAYRQWGYCRVFNWKSGQRKFSKSKKAIENTIRL